EPRDAVDALDELGFTLRRWIHRADLTAALDAARKVLLPAVEKIQFFAFEPQIGPLPRRAADVLRAYTRVVPWPAPEGTLVALEQRGHWDDWDKTYDKRPLLHVASGKERTKRLDVLEAALVAIEAASPSREDHERLLALIDSSEQDDPRANSEAAVRFAVSAIERSRAIKKAREVALAFLAGEGVEPIALEPGERFEPEKHSASAFERKRVRGPAGRVVTTETTGFKDRNGVVLQRAVVAVGDG